MGRSKKQLQRAGSTNHAQNIQTRMAGQLDDLADYEDFKQEILPILRQDMSKGLSADELREKYKNYLVARQISIALTDDDSGKALAAAKDLIDRLEGKAVERKAIAHKFEQLPDDQVDAIIEQKLKELSDEDD